jgi:hypothetical protein
MILLAGFAKLFRLHGFNKRFPVFLQHYQSMSDMKHFVPLLLFNCTRGGLSIVQSVSLTYLTVLEFMNRI